MTLRLILTRHAKSSWDDPTMDDHERPLNGRGRLQAVAVGKWLVSRGYVPGEVLCSTAARTRETCELILDQIDPQPAIQWQPGLYHATPEQMLTALRGATGGTVLLLGHNPGCAYAAGALAATPPLHPRFSHYPTAATTVYDFQAGTWEHVNWGSGQVIDFVVPSDLGVE